MVTFKMDMPGDFGDELRREVEREIDKNLRREGIFGVRVRVDRNGQATFDGSDEALERVKKVLHKL